MEKALLPGQDAAFNRVHPRAPAGTGGTYRPGQFTPKSQAEKQQEEAEDFEGEAEESGGGSASQTVALGPDTKVAMASDHARQRRVAEAIEAPATPEEESQPSGAKAGIRQALGKALDVSPPPALVVLFTRRADATKFAIACDQVIGADSHTRVEADANGRYHVEPYGLAAREIARVQDLIAGGTPLLEIGPELDAPERGEVAPEPDAAPPEDLGGRTTAAGWEETARALIAEAVETGQVTGANLDEVLALAQAIRELSGTREDGVLPILEAIHYGDFAGLRQALQSPDADTAARARLVLSQTGQGLTKGMRMRHLMTLPACLPEHEADKNDGNAVPLGTHERLTAKVGSEENLTEKTAKYPRTGHKAKRRPRLILTKP